MSLVSLPSFAPHGLLPGASQRCARRSLRAWDAPLWASG